MGLEYLSRKLSSLAKTLTDTANKLDELEFLDKGQDSNDSK